MKNKKKCGLLNSFFFFQFNQIAQTTDPICFIDSYVYVYNQFDFIVLLPMRKKSSVFPSSVTISDSISHVIPSGLVHLFL